MENTELENYREIVPDSPKYHLPPFGFEDNYTLNAQSAFNRSLLEGAETCGCFHCGRRYPTSLVKSWMEEPGKEDTGLCPYCGKDTLIMGTAEFPLSTSLLTVLYEHWFSAEIEELKKSPLDIPYYHGWEDYQRKGIPFRWKVAPKRNVLAEINVWSVGGTGEGFEDAEERDDGDGAMLPGVYTDEPLGGTWTVRAYCYEDGYRFFELRRYCKVVHFSPWSGDLQEKLLDLYEKYGKKLRGAFTNTSFDTLQLFLDEE